MRKYVPCAVSLLLAFSSFAQKKEEDRLQESHNVLKEILGTPDKGISRDLLGKAACVVVYPSVKKAGFIVGGHGRGAITCRTKENFNGPWSTPAMFALEGASVGFQIGEKATGFVPLVMHEKAADSVISIKVKLGADAFAAAGPVGRTSSAEPDHVMKAEILSWSRARGAFGGVSLEGSTMCSDDGANKDIYGKKFSAKEIVREGKVRTPESGKPLIEVLQKTSPKHASLACLLDPRLYRQRLSAFHGAHYTNHLVSKPCSTVQKRGSRDGEPRLAHGIVRRALKVIASSFPSCRTDLAHSRLILRQVFPTTHNQLSTINKQSRRLQMAIKNPKQIFVLMLSDLRQGTEKTKSIFQNLAQLAEDPDIKQALEARIFVSQKVVETLDQCFKLIGEPPMQLSGTRTGIYDVLAADFRKEVADIQDTKTRRFYILAKLNNLAHFRAAEYKTLIAAADVSGNYGVATLLETCLADKLALAERTQQWLRRIGESEMAEKIAAKRAA